METMNNYDDKCGCDENKENEITQNMALKLFYVELLPFIKLNFYDIFYWDDE